MMVQVHILSKEIMYLGSAMLKYFPFGMVDWFMVFLSKLVYGDQSKYGIGRPKESIRFLKNAYGKYPILDVGTFKKIKSGEIQVIKRESFFFLNFLNYINFYDN